MAFFAYWKLRSPQFIDDEIEAYWRDEGLEDFTVERLTVRERFRYGGMLPFGGLVSARIRVAGIPIDRKQPTSRYRKIYFTDAAGSDQTMYVDARFTAKKLVDCTVLAHYEI